MNQTTTEIFDGAKRHGIELPSGFSGSGNVYTLCPKCSDSRKKKRVKCLSFSGEKGVWNCHHCGWFGTVNEGGKAPLRLHWEKPTYRKPERIEAKPDLPANVIGWFGERGIGARTLQRCAVKVSSAYLPQIEDFAPCIVFPYFALDEDGKAALVNRKYRSVEGKHFRMEAGARPVFWGLDAIAGCETVVIVEGELDRMACIESGIDAVLSVPHGAPNPGTREYSSKFDFLAESAAATAHVKRWIIWADNDEPGHALEAELSRRLGRERCSRVMAVGDCKDANDVLIKHGPDAVQRMVAGALPWPVEGVYDVAGMSDNIDDLYRHGLPRGVRSAWPDVNDLFTVKPGDLTVVSGIPNSGKSNWVDALCVDICKLHGWHTVICSPENQPLEDHMARICEKWAGVPFSEGLTPRMSLSDLQTVKRDVQQHFSWLLPEDRSVASLLEKAQSLVVQKGARILVLDPWNELDHVIGEREDQYLAGALREVKQFARRNDCHVFIVTHPKTMTKDKNGNYPIPTPYDNSGGAMWRNKADNCLTVWRDFTRKDGAIEIHVQKIRFRQVGKIGSCLLKYEAATATYSRWLPSVPRPRHETELEWEA